MNATARKLGLSKTHFSDPSGLPNPGQYTNYSTVHDLISLGRDAMKLAVFRQVVATRSYHLAAGAGHRAHTWKNLNQLLDQLLRARSASRPGSPPRPGSACCSRRGAAARR